MPIDVNKPADGVPSVKADLRANLQAVATAVATGDSANSGTTITVNAASFGDRVCLRIRCTSGSSVTVLLGNNVAVGRVLELVQYGAGVVTAAADSGATLVKPSAVTAATASQYEALVLEVDTNGSGTNAAWRMVARS